MTTIALAACTTPATQIVVGVATDLDAPAPLQGVRLLVEREGPVSGTWQPLASSPTAYDWTIHGGAAAQELPGSFVVYSDNDATPRVRLTLTGFDPDGAVLLERQAVLPLVREATSFVRLGLTSRCAADPECPSSETCIEGRCRPPAMPELPRYAHDGQAERGVACDSGTSFRDTMTGQDLPARAESCADPAAICSEGVCYPPASFPGALPAPLPITVLARLADPTGQPIAKARLELEDGPVSYLVQLRNGASQPSGSDKETSGETTADPDQPGLFRLNAQADRLTRKLHLTVRAPGFAPHVTAIPVKAGVAEYRLPLVLFPIVDPSVAAGQPRAVALGTGATLALGGAAAANVRFAFVDARFASGGDVAGTAPTLLATPAMLFLENLGAPLPEVAALELALPRGADATPVVVELDRQGRWQRRATAMTAERDGAAVTGAVARSGFWAVGDSAVPAACARGSIGRRAGGAKCGGVRVRAFGPGTAPSFDVTSADGAYCLTVPARSRFRLEAGETSILVEARNDLHPEFTCATARTGDDCPFLGHLVLDDADCDDVPLLRVPTRAPGETCSHDADCRGFASCHDGTCVSDAD